MGGCSGSSREPATIQCFSGGERVLQLVKVESIEEANRLLREGHIYLGVYWNTALSREEYILGKMEKAAARDRRVGFMIR